MTRTRKTQRRANQLPGGRHGLPAEYVVRSQRERLLGAMLEIVAEQGYHATPVSEVIARAGVSGKTFYEQFADKEECFLAAYDDAFHDLLTGTADAYGSPGLSWPERVHHGVAAMLQHLAEFPAEAKVCIVEILAAGPKAIARRDAAIRNFTYFIDSGRSETTAEPPGFVAMAIIGGLNELLYSSIARGATVELPRMTPDFVYLITLPFLGPEGAADERERSRQRLGAVGEPLPRP